jgi:hypothetical protein
VKVELGMINRPSELLVKLVVKRCVLAFGVSQPSHDGADEVFTVK